MPEVLQSLATPIVPLDQYQCELAAASIKLLSDLVPRLASQVCSLVNCDAKLFTQVTPKCKFAYRLGANLESDGSERLWSWLCKQPYLVGTDEVP